MSRLKEHFKQLLEVLTTYVVPIETRFVYKISFLCIRPHELWNDMYLRIAMVTASASSLLQKQPSSNTEV